MKSIYIIGSLKNEMIPDIGNKLRQAGFDVFDDWFAPGPEADDFFRDYTKKRGLTYKEALQTHAAKHIFEFDKKHIDRCDIGVMVMPAGKSGHLELGYMSGQGKKTYILFNETPERYDIMVQFATEIFFNINDLIEVLKKDEEPKGSN